MLDRNSPVPLHHQLSSLLARLIASGYYRPGAAIPPERQLCERYDVSITTVRKAVLDLAARGLVERAIGRGTFVRPPTRQRARIGLVTTQDLTLSESAIMPVVTAIQESAGLRGASLSHFHQDQPGPLSEFLRRVIGRDEVDGIILFTHSPLYYADIAELIASGYPYIVFDRYLDDHPINCVVLNHAEAAAQAVERLYGLGHRQIANLPGYLHTIIGRDRTAGYCDVMQRHDLPAWVLHGGWTIDEGFAATQALLAAPTLPTAILASSDHTATGAIRALRRVGLRVPEDLSVLGFANLPGSEMVDPPLTTMGYDRQRMGRETIAALLELIQGGPPPGKIVVPATFIERRSCGPPPAGGPMVGTADRRQEVVDAAATAGGSG